jgi:hypothetical protein
MESGHEAIVKLLPERFVDIHSKNGFFETSLCLALLKRNKIFAHLPLGKMSLSMARRDQDGG